MTLWRVLSVEKKKLEWCFEMSGGKSVVESRVKRMCAAAVGVKIQYIKCFFCVQQGVN